MDPDRQTRVQWDLVVLVLLIYVCITSPVIVCFTVHLTQFSVLWWVEMAVMSLFMFDVILNFNTAYYGKPAILPGTQLLCLQQPPSIHPEWNSRLSSPATSFV